MKARVQALAGAELAEAFEGWVHGREPLPVAEALATVGLPFSQAPEGGCSHRGPGRLPA